jgi:hypothetical protein
MHYNIYIDYLLINFLGFLPKSKNPRINKKWILDIKIYIYNHRVFVDNNTNLKYIDKY